MRALEFDWDSDEVEQQIAEKRTPGVVVPRPYQEAAIKNVFDRWNSGDVSTLVCLPTGTGKSIVFSEVMRRWVRESR